MTRRTITLRRPEFDMSMNTTIGTAAFNAMNAIPGVNDVRIESESGSEVTLSYSYALSEPFMRTDEHLAKFWLERVVPT